jgi:signal transduction histidine kinase
MRRHVDRELARARAGRSGRHEPVGLRAAAETVVGVLRRTPRGQELAWTVAVPVQLTVAVDAQDLAELLGNLIENAVKWARRSIRVAAAGEAGGVLLTIADDGPGIAADDVSTALLRGARLDETRPGTGLGLAIVSDLAEAYGATLTLGRAPEGGLLAELRLPAATTASSRDVPPPRGTAPLSAS